MERLLEGVRRFREQGLDAHRERLQQLADHGQAPHTLFIACSDSRVLPELITDSDPGDLFVVRNIGNIVPPYHEPNAPFATGAAIEYAVGVLGVANIVVCGHRRCGAIAALIHGLRGHEGLRQLARWVEVAARVRAKVLQVYGSLTEDQQLAAAEEENVLLSVANVGTYPVVEERVRAGTLRVHGWMLDIRTVELSAYDPATGRFEPLLA